MPCGIYPKTQAHFDAYTKNLKFYSGEEHYEWKGEEASYSAKHKWMRSKFGKANKCENKECINKNPPRYEWSNISGEYKRERSDWIMLCSTCHRKTDRKNFCKNGHPFSNDNTRIDCMGARMCLICYYKKLEKRKIERKVRRLENDGRRIGK